MAVQTLKITENEVLKKAESPVYNFIFSKKTGFFARWGKTTKEDPLYAPSAELADIEITTICHGVDGKLCPFCYKSNNPNGRNMSFETFKKLFDKFPKLICQIAFGTDSHATSNPDLFKMMKYSRENGVIPNITVSQISEETAVKIAEVCGACSISRYDNKDICYDSVKLLTDRGMNQTNLHFMTSEETYDRAIETLNDILTDKRLEKLNAIVFLSLKKKGRGKKFTCLSEEKFKKLIDFAMENNISIGFDSCSCLKFLKSVRNHPDFKNFEICSEPCESSIFSIYCNVDAKIFPCSFVEEEKNWEEGLDILNTNDFTKDIWNHPRMTKFRKKLIDTANKNQLKCRSCPVFEI